MITYPEHAVLRTGDLITVALHIMAEKKEGEYNIQKDVLLESGFGKGLN